MRIALVYNQKKEDSTEQSLKDNETEPPSTIGGTPSSSFLPHNPAISHHPKSDLYAEWDTFETIDAVRNALAEIHDVTMIEADEYAYSKFIEHRPQIVFNISEGLHGVSREAQIPAILEMLNIPYTGSDPLTLAVCLDKSRAKEILSFYGVPTPKFQVVSTASMIEQSVLHFPWMVKPLHEGSSKGIYNSSVVKNRDEAKKEITKIIEQYHEPALIEEYLPGREFTVAILGNGSDLTVLPIVEIKFDTLPAGVNPIYSYEAKWIWDQASAPLEIFSCPADLTQELKSEIESVCRKAYTILRCRDWCRIDVRLDSHGTPHIIELNPLPGILPKPEDNSCFPKAARAAGLSYNKLIQSVLSLAAQRYGLIPSAHIPSPTTEAI
jgi:D-alanine-D-alanine ligase